MTNLELIRMLTKHPPDAVVSAFDPEVGNYRPITGCVSGPEPVKDLGSRFMSDPPKTVYRIELQTDDPF